MGQCSCRGGSSEVEKQRILILGLDGAGKTTLLYQLKQHQVIFTTPTMGCNIEHVELEDRHVTMWDVGGQTRMRNLWMKFYSSSEGFLFVVDSTRRERLQEVELELQAVLRHRDMHSKPYVILANKQDLPGAMSIEEIRERLYLEGVPEYQWNIYPVSAVTSHGLDFTLTLLSDRISQRRTARLHRRA